MLRDIKTLFGLTLVCAVLFGVGLSSVPVLDRDEARFAQATYQMLESGDYLYIGFQDQPRTKKPHGIHWLQAASVQMLGDPAEKMIWPYRIPSVLGAWLAVLLAYGLARDLFGRRAGVIAGFGLALCPLLIMEAHIATADAALLAAVLAAQWPLARAFRWGTQPDAPRPGPVEAVAFWVAILAGTLLKGPVAPGIVGLTAAVLIVATRSSRWLSPLYPIRGAIVSLAVLAGWAVLADSGERGSFLVAALREDFLPKLAGGAEEHGAPPGLHALIALIGLGVAFPFAIAGLVRAWRRRPDPRYAFLLAWLIPAWITFELVPTKLPHYPLPIYPALIIMGAVFLADMTDEARGRTLGGPTRSLFAVWAMAGLIAAGVAVALLRGSDVEQGLPVESAMAVGLVLAFGFAAAGYAGLRGRPFQTAAAGALTTVIVTVALFAWIVPALSTVWITEGIAEAAERQGWNGTSPVVSVAYDEPSLVFRLGTDTRFTDIAGAAARFTSEPGVLAIVNGIYRDTFEQVVRDRGQDVEAFASVRGLHYSKGRWITVWLYES